MRVFLASVLMIIVGVLSAPTFAHEQKTAISRVFFNPRTQNIEVEHRFYIHDAEHAVKQLFDRNADILGKEETRSTFADYVAKTFAIAGADGTVIPLEDIGYEMDGRYFWVYQEAKPQSDLAGLLVKSDTLREVWPSQINTVNIEGNGDIQTVTFEGDAEILGVDFSGN